MIFHLIGVPAILLIQAALANFFLFDNTAPTGYQSEDYP